ncbi:MAG: transposase [Chloroflexi bacterium]|nr:transposase [Chloroflexota bacterium]
MESWFGQFEKRCAWRAERGSIEHARQHIAAYIDKYHRRPHSEIGYRTHSKLQRRGGNTRNRRRNSDLRLRTSVRG